MQRLVLFQVGGRRLGLDMALTKSIEATDFLDAKQSSSKLRDTMVVDDEEVPVYDLSAIMGDERSTPDSRSKKVMLVKAQGRYLALLVDRVDRAVEVESGLIESLPPIFEGTSRDCFPKVLRREDGLILILSPEALEGIAPSQARV